MTEGEFLRRMDMHMERIDAHMERGNELMTRLDGQMERGNELMTRVDEHMTRSEERYATMVDEQRTFMRDCLLRLDRIFERQARAIDDMRDQIRANTEATWRMLDRFDSDGGATA